MASQRFPSDSDRDHKRHHPEFIMIENTSLDHSEQIPFREKDQKGEFEFLHRLEEANYPLSLRFVLLFASVLFLLGVLVLLLATCLCAVLALCTLFHFPAVNQRVVGYWRAFCKLCVLFLGSSLAIVNPSFGFGIIALYFLLIGEELDDEMIVSMMQLKKPYK